MKSKNVTMLVAEELRSIYGGCMIGPDGKGCTEHGFPFDIIRVPGMPIGTTDITNPF